MFSRLDFTYDAERDVYICPNGRFLRTTGTVHDGRARNYLSQSGECRVCELKERCTRAPFRKIARDINEEARDHVRALMGTPEFEGSYPFFDPQHGPNTNVVLRARDAKQLARAKRAVEDMLERVRGAQSSGA
jgi:hypothetical protein